MTPILPQFKPGAAPAARRALGLARNGLTVPGPPPNEDSVKKFGRKQNMQTKRTFVLSALTAAALSALSVGASAADAPKIAVDLTTLTSPFWTAYNQYIVNEAKAQGVDLLQPFNSEFDTAKQITGVKNAVTLGANGLIFSPFDSSAAGTILKTAAAANVKVVAVDVAPTPVRSPSSCARTISLMARRPVSISASMWRKARSCRSWVIRRQSMAATAATASATASRRTIPKLKELEIPTKAWSGEDAAAGLDTVLNSTPDLKAIYMHAGGVFLAPTLQTLRRKGMLHPAGEAGHIVIVSNDGIPQEFDAIRKGETDATVSQPADLYAKYGIMYLKDAIEGKTFKAGPTDHDSTILEVAPGVLEDQLSAPLVTKANVDDKAFWGNNPK